MKGFLRFLQMLALGGWIGAIVYFAAVVTAGAFAVLPNRDLAGAVVGYTIGGLHDFGIVAAVIYLLAAIALRRSLAAFARPAAIGVALMLLLTLASQRTVIPRMDALRSRMGSVDATAAINPLRMQFDRLHGISVDLEVAILLIGIAALYLTTREATAVKPAVIEIPVEPPPKTRLK
ncbi:MAG: DUF4149 domain-containing protein [Acidobacteriota bacterium]|nr:DUF4149 domain-containing protein [Acidobacteriota bacterium]